MMGAMRHARPCTGLIPFLVVCGSVAEATRDANAPMVDAAIDTLNVGTADAKIAALRAKAAAAVSRSKAQAAQAKTASIHVEQLLMENKLKRPQLAEALLLARKSAAKAEEAAKEAAAALKQVKQIAKTAPGDAARMAVDEVRKSLVEKYHNLDRWRTRVLDNPYERARKAGLKAASPYNAMIRAYYARIGQYQAEASKMMGKANQLAAGAQGLAGGAQGRLDGGDPVGANQDIMTANAMRKQSASLAGAADSLHAEANKMNSWIPEYIAAGHMAAWIAEFKADPDALPPPPVNVNYAFTPPPPR